MFLKLQTTPTPETATINTQPMSVPETQDMGTSVLKLKQASEQAAAQNIINTNNMIKEQEKQEIIQQEETNKLATSDWNDIKLNIDNLKHVVNLTNIDEMIYPHLELCDNLKSMSFSEDFNNSINLKNLSNLENVTFGSYFNQVVSKDTLPANLKSLTLGLNFIRKLDSLPANLSELYINNRYNTTISLPSNLKVLSLGDSFNQDIHFPSTLESLSFGYHFNKSIKLPKSLKQFTMSNKFNQDILLNEGLEELTVGNQFNKKLVLPKSAKKLILKNRNTLSNITLNENVTVVI
jgi:hypothetical protein